jgi:hypothetical protein
MLACSYVRRKNHAFTDLDFEVAGAAAAADHGLVMLFGLTR